MTKSVKKTKNNIHYRRPQIAYTQIHLLIASVAKFEINRPQAKWLVVVRRQPTDLMQRSTENYQLTTTNIRLRPCYPWWKNGRFVEASCFGVLKEEMLLKTDMLIVDLANNNFRYSREIRALAERTCRYTTCCAFEGLAKALIYLTAH